MALRTPFKLTAGGILAVAVVGAAWWLPVGDSTAAPAVTVYKSPTCGCCNAWIDHLKANGFTVEARDTHNLPAIKAEYGVPGEMSSCHTATVDGYVIEGHVPAADIRRLLTDKPDIGGLTVPGMPIGSPGMEQDGHQQPYAVMTLGEEQPRIYSLY